MVTKSQEVQAARATAPGAAVPGTRPAGAFAAFIQKLSVEAETVTEESSGINPAEALVSRAVEAADESALWEIGDLAGTAGKDLLDVEQSVTGFDVRFGKGANDAGETMESRFTDSQGRQMFLLIRAVKLEDGSDLVWNTGAPDVVIKLTAFRDKHGKCTPENPLDCVIRAVDLGGGKAVLKLRPLPKRAVRGN